MVPSRFPRRLYQRIVSKVSPTHPLRMFVSRHPPTTFGGIYSISSSLPSSSTSTNPSKPTSSLAAASVTLSSEFSSSHHPLGGGVTKLESLIDGRRGVSDCLDRRRVREAEGRGVSVGGMAGPGAGVRRLFRDEEGGRRRAGSGVLCVLRDGWRKWLDGKEERDLEGATCVLEADGWVVDWKRRFVSDAV